jgi:four helix bundle protein
MSDDLIIFKKTYDFSKWLFQHTTNFPKSHRFSVAVQIENSILELLRQITVANHRKQKMPLLRQADETLLALKIFIRLSHDLKFISTKSFEFAIRQMQEIGRLLGGWIKSQAAA